VHREQHRVRFGRYLTTLLGRQQLAEDRHIGPRPGQLPAHTQSQETADEKPQQSAEQELNANNFVVARKYIRR
jgi:hypothetical protein